MFGIGGISTLGWRALLQLYICKPFRLAAGVSHIYDLSLLQQPETGAQRNASPLALQQCRLSLQPPLSCPFQFFLALGSTKITYIFHHRLQRNIASTSGHFWPIWRQRHGEKDQGEACASRGGHGGSAGWWPWRAAAISIQETRIPLAECDRDW